LGRIFKLATVVKLLGDSISGQFFQNPLEEISPTTRKGGHKNLTFLMQSNK
jgi:hypothetical protein